MTLNWNRRSYTEDEFREAWLSSSNIRECALKLGIGLTSPTTHKTARALGLTTDHMTDQIVNNLPKVEARTLEEVLVYGKQEPTSGLRKRLIKEEIFKKECCMCKNTIWLDKPIALELDHIDGDRLNNTFKNLRLLCPNCHAQTDTYRGKNKSPSYFYTPKNVCSFPECSTVIRRTSKTCKAHMLRPKKIDWPPLDVLMQLVVELRYEGAARKLGVSSNAIRKHLQLVK